MNRMSLQFPPFFYISHQYKLWIVRANSNYPHFREWAAEQVWDITHLPKAWIYDLMGSNALLQKLFYLTFFVNLTHVLRSLEEQLLVFTSSVVDACAILLSFCAYFLPPCKFLVYMHR